MPIRLVYIAEAHASDEWPVGAHIRQRQPKTTLERCRVAAARLAELGVQDIPCLVDTADDAFSRRYACWPLRWFFVRDGVIEQVAQPHGASGYDLSEVVTWLVARRAERRAATSSTSP